jgi:hypothetical protein
LIVNWAEIVQWGKSKVRKNPIMARILVNSGTSEKDLQAKIGLVFKNYLQLL